MTEIQTRSQALVKAEAKLELLTPEYEKLLQGRMDVDYFVMCAISALRETPRLLDCDPNSVLRAVREAATLRLEVDGVLGHAHIIPYGKEAKLIPGYKGYIQLMLDGGCRKIVAHVVDAADTFEVDFGTDAISHKPSMEPTGEWLGAYCKVWLENGETTFRFVTAEKILQIKKSVIDRKKPGQKPTPWETENELPMWEKTAIRAVFKYIPLRSSVQRMAAFDEQEEAGVLTEREVDAEVLDQAEKLDSLAETLRNVNEVRGKEVEEEPEKEKDESHGGLDQVAGEEYVADHTLLSDAAIPWTEGEPYGGYPYPADGPRDFAAWHLDLIGGRTRLKDMRWSDIKPASDEHDFMRECVDKIAFKFKGEDWPAQGKVPTEAQQKLAIILRCLDEEKAHFDASGQEGGPRSEEAIFGE